MGWGATDYPSAPTEYSLKCSHGCGIHDGQVYACQAKACDHDSLCVGHVWQCADCQEDFCESHIVDLNDVAGARYSVFVCGGCHERRQRQVAREIAA